MNSVLFCYIIYGQVNGICKIYKHDTCERRAGWTVTADGARALRIWGPVKDGAVRIASISHEINGRI